MALEGRVAIVTGGSGTVGSGIVQQFLSEGAYVVAPFRSEKGKAALLLDLSNAPTDRLEMPIVNINNDTALHCLVQGVQGRHGAIHHAVGCIGSWVFEDPLTKTPTDTFESQLASVVTHYKLAKAILPSLEPEPSSSYTIITGSAGEACSVPQLCLATVRNAALYGMALALQSEYANGPRVNELRISNLIRRHTSERNEEYKEELGPQVAYSNRAIGREVVRLATSDIRGQVIKPTQEDLAAYTE